MKQLTILGATGSIGTNCLEVVRALPDEFSVVALSAYKNVDRLYRQAQEFHPRLAAVVSLADGHRQEWQRCFSAIGTELLTGPGALVQLAAENVDVVVNAVVGAAGLPATLQAIGSATTVALANKETLVTAGELVTANARRTGAKLIPIDSEHSALWQCLCGEPRDRIARLIITASGGPFREWPAVDLAKVSVAEALNHPNWNMGKKITIDSATMMNKGLEVIEAYWLFGQPIDKIEVLIHPQSIIHSMVEFVDGSIKAQLSLPDMRLPIQYALTYPDRLPNELPRLDLARLQTLTFYPPDPEKFSCLRLAIQALEAGGTAPAVLNAANEEAVHAFLEERIRFDEIPALIARALECHDNGYALDYDGVMAADSWAREFVLHTIGT